MDDREKCLAPGGNWLSSAAALRNSAIYYEDVKVELSPRYGPAGHFEVSDSLYLSLNAGALGSSVVFRQIPVPLIFCLIRRISSWLSGIAQGAGTGEPYMLWKVCERMSHTALLEGSLTYAEHLKGHTPWKHDMLLTCLHEGRLFPISNVCLFHCGNVFYLMGLKYLKLWNECHIFSQWNKQIIFLKR